MKQRVAAGLLGFCVLLSAVAAGGCSGVTSGAGKTIREPETAAAEKAEAHVETEEETEEETLDEETMDLVKYNIYVEMNNDIVEVLDNLDSYYTVVEYADEFALIPDSGYSYKFDISPFNSSIVDDAVAVASMEPAYEGLDDLAMEIAEPMRTLMDTFSDIYGSNDFADNQYAKAREYHDRIQQNAAVFQDLAYAFMDKVDVIGNERMQEQEKQLLDDGELIAYNASHLITIGKQILNECYEQEISDENITELDLTNIRPLLEELKATVAAYEEAVSDNNQLVKESLSNSTPMSGLPQSLADSVEWMIRQVESGKPIEDPGREYLGGIIHIEKVLSDCIERYNTVFAEQ